MSKTNIAEVYNFIESCISLDEVMKKVNRHYTEIGYPTFKGVQTDCTNIHKFDVISKESVEALETSEKYKNFRESIENPEVDIFIDRLLEDAKAGAMPFNDSSLTCKDAARYLIYNCLSVECVDNINEAAVNNTKNLYTVCEQELQMYQPYILPIIQNIMSNDTPKEQANKNQKGKK